MKIATSTFCFIVCMALAACLYQTPDEVFVIPQNQLVAVEKKANEGDLASIKRLIAHYDSSSHGEVYAERWRAKARDLGDPEELYYYAARLFTASRVEADPAKKREQLTAALKAAERSLSNHEDESTRQLIEDITRSSKGM